jgi:hypothetical protein
MGTREYGVSTDCRRNSAQQVKQQVLAVPQNILDVVAEDPQEPHVPQHVHPTAVQKHGSQYVDEPKMIGNQPKGADEGIL